MKYSVFTVGLPEYKLEESAALLQKYGYDGVEWRVGEALKGPVDPKVPFGVRYWQANHSTVEISTILDEAPHIKALSDSHGLEIAALAPYLPVADKYTIANVAQAAQIMGCPQIRISVPTYDGSVPYPRLLDETIDHIENLIPIAEKTGVRLNIELHFGNIVPSCSAAHRLVSNFDPKYIGIIHDAGNMVFEGYEQYQMGLEILGPYLAHIHIKNARWIPGEELGDGTQTWHMEWPPMPKGVVDFRTLLKALKSVGYDGWLSFEDFSNEHSTEQKIKNNIEYLKALEAELANQE